MNCVLILKFIIPLIYQDGLIFLVFFVAAVVAPGLYGGYVGYYSQPSPLMPTPGIFGNPPFFPPSTVPDQTYSIASSVNQAASITSMAQTTAALANPTPCSPANMSVPSPSATSLSHTHAAAAGVSWTLASSLANNNSRNQQACSDAPAPPHAFQITMPPSSNALTPPPRSMPGRSSFQPAKRSGCFVKFPSAHSNLFCHDLPCCLFTGHCFGTCLVACPPFQASSPQPILSLSLTLTLFLSCSVMMSYNEIEVLPYCWRWKVRSCLPH